MYFGAIDQGTTSTRFILFSRKGEIIASAQKEHKQHFPKPGWVEHDPEEIWKNTSETIRETLRKADVKAAEIKGIGITNQRETIIAWNRETGKPYYNAIVWQDLRGTDLINSIKETGREKEIQETTGLILNPYFAASKIVWLLDNIPGLRKDAESGKAVFGTIDTYLVWKLTGGKVFTVDVTNASRYLLMNLRTLSWDKGMLSLFNIPECALPQIVPSIGRVYGYTDKHGPFGEEIPIAGVLGDQQAALFGQACFTPGTGKCTYGTGCFLLANIGNDVCFSKNGLLTTVAYQIEGEKPVYAFEGSIAVAGSLVQWARDNLKIIKTPQELDQLASEVADSGGVYVVPAFSGLFAPYWRSDARGVIAGLTGYTDRRHISRAILEATAFQLFDIVKVLEMDSGITMNSMKADGGLTNSTPLMAFQADILGIPIIKPRIVETTALGVAFAAGLTTGVYSGLDELSTLWQEKERYECCMTDEERDNRVNFWHKAVSRTLCWMERK
ncbi:MAG: glycerol kinase GlpK [Spirochaetes bacterium]|uniref:glycerol kinase n=1 Tax=Candidatus Ornithospirochaeta stercoravium TaxID=2840897 RepID=A0A9D9IB00_9SPIO|nr:glycerol kinase GlpK [Candidatus Ornithospirochaeta stercoravium]